MEPEVKLLDRLSVIQIESPIEVLHVDDETGFLEVSKQILELKENFEVDTASSVAEALKKMEVNTYDVVVSDYQMPEKDGLQFLKELRDSGNKIPFIIFTGRGREEVAIKALNLGADQYLHKSGTPETVYGELAYSILKSVSRKRAEKKLRESEEEHRALLGMASMLVQSVNSEGKFIYVNKEWEKVLGYTQRDLKEISIWNVIRKDRLQHCMSVFKQVMEGQTVKDVETVFVAKNGKEVVVHGNAMPRIKDGRFIATVGFFSDITGHKKAEDLLTKSEEMYRNIVEMSPDGIATVNTKGVVTSVNEAFVKLTGFSSDELVGKHFTKLGTLRKRDIPKLAKLFVSMVRGKTPEPFEIAWQHRDGKQFQGEVRVSLLKEAGKTVGIQAITRDITERKTKENALRNSENKYRTLLENLPQKIFFKDENSVYIACNGNYARDLKIKPDEIAGKTDYDFYPEKLAEKYRADDKRLMESGKTADIEEEYIQDGKKLFVHTVKTPVKEANGNVAGILGIFWDITEDRLMREKLEMTVGKLKLLNEKLGVVGSLTRHDVRNKLSAITGNIYLAKQKTPDNEVLMHLREVDSSVSQIVKILDFASAYEKLGAEKLFTIDVGKTIDEAVSLFSDLSNVKVVNDCHGLAVLADSLLRQLFYNLIHNSLMHGENVSHIRTYFDETDKDAVMLVYEDNGVGIPKTEKEKIFEKGYGKGTGYGLFLIQKMCEIYGWTIRETGKHCKGAQFTITILRRTQKERSL
jgi:PAS domain S-box-containing protein